MSLLILWSFLKYIYHDIMKIDKKCLYTIVILHILYGIAMYKL